MFHCHPASSAIFQNFNDFSVTIEGCWDFLRPAVCFSFRYSYFGLLGGIRLYWLRASLQKISGEERVGARLMYPYSFRAIVVHFSRKIPNSLNPLWNIIHRWILQNDFPLLRECATGCLTANRKRMENPWSKTKRETQGLSRTHLNMSSPPMVPCTKTVMTVLRDNPDRSKETLDSLRWIGRQFFIF